MINLIVGEKGKGKTKEILDLVNAKVKSSEGNIVYLDKNAKHMYELNNKIRLIDVSEYKVRNSDEFLGFLKGILSQDRDLQHMYFDSFLNIACVDESNFEDVVQDLEDVSEQYATDFVLSVSFNKEQIPEEVKSKIIVSL